MRKRNLLETINRFQKVQQRIANKYQCKVSIVTTQGETVIADGSKLKLNLKKN